MAWVGISGSGAAELDYQWITLSGGGSNATTGTPDWPGAFGPKSNINVGSAIDVFGEIFADIDGSGVAHTFYLPETDQDGVFSLTQAGSAIGSPFVGTATNVLYIHADIDGDGNATVDPDECETVVTTNAFNSTVQSLNFVPSRLHVRPSAGMRLRHRRH